MIWFPRKRKVVIMYCFRVWFGLLAIWVYADNEQEARLAALLIDPNGRRITWVEKVPFWFENDLILAVKRKGVSMYCFRVWFGEISVLVNADSEKAARSVACQHIHRDESGCLRPLPRKRITWVEKLEKILEFWFDKRETYGRLQLVKETKETSHVHYPSSLRDSSYRRRYA